MNGPGIGRLLDAIDPPLWVVTSAHGPAHGGLIATFVTQTSIVPEMPRMLAVISRQHRTWELIEGSGAFALHLLDETVLDWVVRFGGQTGRRGLDKFDGLRHEPGVTGVPILLDAPGWLECRVESRLDTGDRTVYLAAVLDGGHRREFEPLRVGRMLESLPPDSLDALQERLEHDIALDSAAIAAWRSADQTVPRQAR